MAHDVFISHSAKDKTTADAVCAMLESNGIRCWIAPRDVTPGREWGECIIEAIKECRIMVLVFTAHANESPQIRREVERAVNHGVAILPFRVEDVVPSTALEYFIGNVHWLDALTPPLEAHLKILSETVKILLARMPYPPPPPIPPPDLPHAVERKERALDAAIPRSVSVGTATQVVAMVREADSQGLKRVLQIEEDFSAKPEDVRSRDIEIEFPLDSHGNPRPVEFTLRLEAPDFEPRSQSKRLFIPVTGDSEICSFLVTAQRPGQLLLNLEVLKEESNVVTRTFKTTAHPAGAGLPLTGNVLVSVPLYTSASTWSVPRYTASMPQSMPGSSEPIHSYSPSAESRLSPVAARRSASSSGRKRIVVSALFAIAILALGIFAYYKWKDTGTGDVNQKTPSESPANSTGISSLRQSPIASNPGETQSGGTSLPGGTEQLPQVSSSDGSSAGALHEPTASKAAKLFEDTTRASPTDTRYFPTSPVENSRQTIFESPAPDAANIASRLTSCNEGHASGCTDLAYLYEHGLGVAKDTAHAAQLYQKACDGGDGGGCTDLGFMYGAGEGFVKDEARAVTLYQKGCDAGDAWGCFDTSYAFGMGRGVPADKKRAALFMQEVCDLDSGREACDQVNK